MIEELIKNVAQKLDEEKIAYMVIGGQAVLIYGRPRLTKDIDITLGVDTDKFSAIEKVCEKLKLKLLPDTPRDFAEQTRVLPVESSETKIRVDFIFSFMEYERQAIGRAKPVDMNGFPVKFASCEDVIIHKMVASRAIDWEDVKSIILKNRESLDVQYIKNWLSQFSEISEYEGVLEKFEQLWEQYGK